MPKFIRVINDERIASLASGCSCMRPGTQDILAVEDDDDTRAFQPHPSAELLPSSKSALFSLFYSLS